MSIVFNGKNGILTPGLSATNLVANSYTGNISNALVTATGTLSARSLANRFGDVINVKDFGAVGDGVTDDTAAIQAAINAAIATGKILYIPSGVYTLSNVISATTSNKPCSIIGNGQSLSILNWSAGAVNGGGLSITYTSFPFPPYIGNMSLYNSASGVGTALTITGPDVTSSTFYGPIVEKLDIRGGNFFSHCWNTGINFVKCWYPKVEDVNINGLNEYGPTFISDTGIKITSCQVCYFNNFNIFHVNSGILELSGSGIEHGEGFTFCNFEIVGVGTGISLTAEQPAPGTNIGPGHINAFNYGLSLTNQFQTSIHNLLIYKTDDLSGIPQSFVGINLYDCRSNRVHDNIIHGFKAANLVGIQMTGGIGGLSDYNNVHDNLFYDFTNSAGNKIGIVVGSGTGNSLIHHNYADSTVTTPILLTAGRDLTNIFHNNYPVQGQQFPDGDTSPSVANALNDLFLASNTTSTTVTAFDDGFNGQCISIYATNSNTTIQHNINLSLAGSTNFAMAAGDIVQLRLIGTLWKEVSRTKV